MEILGRKAKDPMGKRTIDSSGKLVVRRLVDCTIRQETLPAWAVPRQCGDAVQKLHRKNENQ